MLQRWIKSDFVPGLVSTIVPVYNGSKYIIETLDSVVASTYRPIELIVINDGSSDESGAIVADWVKNLPKNDDFHARVLEQLNSGASAARNNAAIQSQGEFIHFLDQDDMVVPVWYDYSVRALQAHKDCGMVWAGWKTAETGAMNGAVRWCMENDAVYADGICEPKTPPFFWCSLFRRETLSLVGPHFTEAYPGEDFNYFLRAQAHGVNIRRLPCTLLVYRQHEDQNSRNRKWGLVDAVLRAVENAEDVERSIAMPPDRKLRVRKEFAGAYRVAIFFGIAGRHKDLVFRASRGLRRYMQVLPFRQRMQLSLLTCLATRGWSGLALAIGRLFYGRGSFESGPRISRRGQTINVTG